MTWKTDCSDIDQDIKDIYEKVDIDLAANSSHPVSKLVRHSMIVRRLVSYVARRSVEFGIRVERDPKSITLSDHYRYGYVRDNVSAIISEILFETKYPDGITIGISALPLLPDDIMPMLTPTAKGPHLI